MVDSLTLGLLAKGQLSNVFAKVAAPPNNSGARYIPSNSLEEDSGARFGNITIFPDRPMSPTSDDLISGAHVPSPVPSVSDLENSSEASAVLFKPYRRRGSGGSRAWRPNPSFPEHDYERMVEAASVHGMSAGSFIVALCQAYVYCSPFILKQHLRPSIPPMTAEEHRTFINVANNLNQIARAMNEARKIALDHGTTYPAPPEELGPLLQALYMLLKVEQ